LCGTIAGRRRSRRRRREAVLVSGHFVSFLLKLLALVLLTAAGVVSMAPGPAGAVGVRAVAAGGAHTCALTATGGVKCWGVGTSGQRGDASTELRRYEPVDVCGNAACATPLTGATAITAGNAYSCALMEGGTVKCWGANAAGQLGNGQITDQFSATPFPVDVCADATCSAPLSGVLTVAAGSLHTCALMRDGGVKCWGENFTGQLGDNQACGAIACAAPVDVCADAACAGRLRGVAALGLGERHSCALMLGGGVKCWGDNTVGELGDGDGGFVSDSPFLRFRSVPGDVCQEYEEEAARCTEAFSGARGIAAGFSHTCAIVADGGVACWGWSGDGVLGDGFACVDRTRPFPTFFCPTPTRVCQAFDEPAELCREAFGGATAITAGYGQTCALIDAGRVMCWGQNAEHGGSGACGGACLTPEPVCANVPCSRSLSGALVDAGNGHTCVVPPDMGLTCWGANFYGQLGAGVCCNDSRVPLAVVGLGPKPTPTATATATSPLLTATPIPSRTEPAATAVAPTVGALPETGHGGGSGPSTAWVLPVALAGAGAALAGCAARLVRRERRRQ